MKVNARSLTVDTQIAANPTRDNYLSTRANSTLDRPIVIFRYIKRHVEAPACELFLGQVSPTVILVQSGPLHVQRCSQRFHPVKAGWSGSPI